VATGTTERRGSAKIVILTLILRASSTVPGAVVSPEDFMPPFRSPLHASLVALALALPACSGGDPPEAQLGAGAQAVTAAEQSQAPRFAPVELQTAREKLNAIPSGCATCSKAQMALLQIRKTRLISLSSSQSTRTFPFQDIS
jgi:hypothetical protein